MMDLKFIADAFVRLANLLGQVMVSQNALTSHLIELERKQKVLEQEVKRLKGKQ